MGLFKNYVSQTRKPSVGSKGAGKQKWIMGTVGMALIAAILFGIKAVILP